MTAKPIICAQQPATAAPPASPVRDNAAQIAAEEIGNVIIDFNRKEDSADRRHRRHDCSLEAYNVGDDLVASDEDIATDFIEKQDREQLYLAIQKLKPNQQDLISKLFFEGISQDEYARINGITKGAVSQRKEVAIKKLKLFLKKT